MRSGGKIMHEAELQRNQQVATLKGKGRLISIPFPTRCKTHPARKIQSHCEESTRFVSQQFREAIRCLRNQTPVESIWAYGILGSGSALSTNSRPLPGDLLCCGISSRRCEMKVHKRSVQEPVLEEDRRSRISIPSLENMMIY